MDCPGGTAALNPTLNQTYDVITSLFAEYSSIFSSPYFHLGGDNSDTACWLQDSNVSQWAASMGSSSPLSLYFTTLLTRFAAIPPASSSSPPKKAIVWQEAFSALTPSLSPSLLPEYVQLWKNSTSESEIRAIVDGKRKMISSVGWCEPRSPSSSFSPRTWKQMYTSNPHLTNPGEDIDPSTVIGGEMCFWGMEYDRYNLDSALWPLSSAVAERLWIRSALEIEESTISRLRMFRCRLALLGWNASPVGDDYCPFPSASHLKVRQWNLILEPSVTMLTLIAVFCIYVGSKRLGENMFL